MGWRRGWCHQATTGAVHQVGRGASARSTRCWPGGAELSQQEQQHRDRHCWSGCLQLLGLEMRLTTALLLLLLERQPEDVSQGESEGPVARQQEAVEDCESHLSRSVGVKPQIRHHLSVDKHQRRLQLKRDRLVKVATGCGVHHSPCTGQVWQSWEARWWRDGLWLVCCKHTKQEPAFRHNFRRTLLIA